MMTKQSLPLVRAVLAALTVATASPALAQSDPSPIEHPTAPKQEVQKKHQDKPSGALIEPRVFFVGLKDGAKVKGPLKVKFGVEGMKVAKAGAVVPGTGHHHVIVDGGPVAKGSVVPKDETHLHYGDAQTEATLTLPKGQRKLTLQFADGAHVSYGEEMSATVVVDVQ